MKEKNVGINLSNDLNVLIVIIIIIMDVYVLDECVFVHWEAGKIQMCWFRLYGFLYRG